MAVAPSQTDPLFAGSIPELYEEYLVPLIFQPYADDLASRIAAAQSRQVLEVAAGTGVVTRALSAQLDPTAALTATDLNQPMLDFAASRGTAHPVTWRQADALQLPFDDGSFDAVVCQFGVMFFPDRGAGWREFSRVLRPGGTLAFNVWDRIEDNEFADVVTEAVAAMFPDDPPRFLARTPHGHHDVAVFRGELQRAGFADVAVETIAARSTAPSPMEPAIGYCQGTPLRNEIEARDAARLEEATRVAADAMTARYGSGQVDGKIQAHVFTARRP